MLDLPSSKPSYSGLHPPWECLAPSQFPRYVTSRSTGQGHTHVRPTMSCGTDIRKQQPSPCPKFRDIIIASTPVPYPSDFCWYPGSYALPFRLRVVPRTCPKFRARADSTSGSSRGQARTFTSVWHPFMEQPRSLPFSIFTELDIYHGSQNSRSWTTSPPTMANSATTRSQIGNVPYRLTSTGSITSRRSSIGGMIRE